MARQARSNININTETYLRLQRYAGGLSMDQKINLLLDQAERWEVTVHGKELQQEKHLSVDPGNEMSFYHSAKV